MTHITVYHGAACTVEKPLCAVGRPNLDFGRGFYVTNLQQQAEDWARRVCKDQPPMLNRYTLHLDRVLTAYRCLRFEAYDRSWLDFIVRCRQGEPVWSGYDYIEGGVADDRVFDTVNAYILGFMSADVALGRLAQHLPNNQMCLLSQSLIDECLQYIGCEPINLQPQKGGTP